LKWCNERAHSLNEFARCPLKTCAATHPEMMRPIKTLRIKSSKARCAYNRYRVRSQKGNSADCLRRRERAAICMAHGSSPLLFSRLARLEFPGSEAVRQLWRVAPTFISAIFSREGMLTREGRILIRGKFRRLLICSVPPLARHLRAHYGLQGGCNSCGASCNLLFRCPHWDTDSRLCTVYESRPRVCRTFPITLTDLRDRDLVLRHTACGFHFAVQKRRFHSESGL
jgi:hypothetical protein